MKTLSKAWPPMHSHQPRQLSCASQISALAAMIMLISAATPASADWIIEQQANSAPGAESGGTGRQEVFAKPGKVLVIDKDHGRWAGLFRLDQRTVYELDLERHTYFRRPFSWYEELRSRRDAERRDAIERFQREKDPRVRAQLEERMVELGLRTDGRVIATLERTGETKQLGQWQSEHVVIRENGVVIFDMWVTKDLARPKPLLQLYREIGLFSPEVVEQAEAIDGFPLVINARIDVGGPFAADHQAMVLRAREVDEIEDSAFEVPGNFREVEPPKPGSAAPAAPANGDLVTCEACGRQLAEKQALYFRDPLDGFKPHPVCSAKCRIERARRRGGN